MHHDNNNFSGSTALLKVVSYSLKVGLIFTFLGAAFKVQHFPGANILLVVGLTTLSLNFLFGSFEPANNGFQKLFFGFAMSLFTIGLLLKWMHWPGANLAIIVSLFLLSIHYILKAFFRSINPSVKKSQQVAFYFSYAIVIISFLFRILNWPGAGVVIGIGYVAILVMVLIQLNVLKKYNLFLVDLVSVKGFSTLCLILILLFQRLDSSISKNTLTSYLMRYEMLDHRINGELESAARLHVNTDNPSVKNINALTADFIADIDLMKQRLVLLSNDGKSLLTKSNNRFKPIGIDVWFYSEASSANGTGYLREMNSSLVDIIRDYKMKMDAIVKASGTSKLKGYNPEGMLDRYNSRLVIDEFTNADDIYFAYALNITLLNTFSELQYEALKNRNLLLSQL